MEQDLTRGQYVAAHIKAHPEMTEREIAAMVDAQIATALKEATAELRRLVDAIARKARRAIAPNVVQEHGWH